MKIIKVSNEVYQRLVKYKNELQLKNFSKVIFELSEFYGE